MRTARSSSVLFPLPCFCVVASYSISFATKLHTPDTTECPARFLHSPNRSHALHAEGREDKPRGNAEKHSPASNASSPCILSLVCSELNRGFIIREPQKQGGARRDALAEGQGQEYFGVPLQKCPRVEGIPGYCILSAFVCLYSSTYELLVLFYRNARQVECRANGVHVCGIFGNCQHVF